MSIAKINIGNELTTHPPPTTKKEDIFWQKYCVVMK